MLNFLQAAAIASLLLAIVDSQYARAAEPVGGKATTHVGKFALADAQGERHDERELSEGRATVLVFLGTECPVSNGYAPELTRLAREFRAREIGWLGVQSDPDVSAERAAKHAQEYRLDFPMLMDPQQTLARATGVTMMPEVAVVRADGLVVYRGRIDDRYTDEGKRRAAPQRHDLREALGAVLKGELPAVRETRAFGCPLPRLVQK